MISRYVVSTYPKQYDALKFSQARKLVTCFSSLTVIALGIIPYSFSYYLPALGIYWNSWRTLQAVFSVPSIVMAIGFYFMTESPKFFLARGDEKKALETLRIIHRRNLWGKKEEYEVRYLALKFKYMLQTCFFLVPV